jgi:hypothetical protein
VPEWNLDRLSWHRALAAAAAAIIGFTFAGCTVPSDCLSNTSGDKAVITFVDSSIITNGSRGHYLELCIDDLPCTKQQIDFDAVAVNDTHPQIDVTFSNLALPADADVRVELTASSSDPTQAPTRLSGVFRTEKIRTDCGADSLRLELKAGGLNKS